jgi:uncharacterized protein involved in exopolysaccharide biosynthesis
MLLIAAVTFLLPRTYYSEAKLIVKPGWQNTLDATATTGQAVSFFEPRENEINSILEVIKSRDVARGIVRVLGPDVISGDAPIPEIPGDGVVKELLQQGDGANAAEQRALQALEKQMLIWVPKHSNTIMLRAEARSPELAQAINAACLAVFRSLHADVSRTEGSYAFFQQQERELRERWQSATNALRDAKNRAGVATLAGRRSMLESQLADVQKSQLASESEIAAANANIASLRRNLEATPRLTETTRAENANSAADNMRASLYQLQMKQKEMLSKYTDQHPAVVALNEQVADLERLLAAEGRTRVQSTTTLNQTWTHLEAIMLSDSSSLEAALARKRTLDDQHQQLLAQLRQLNADEIRLTELQQAVDVAEKAYYETANRLEQARVQRDLSEQRISNVSVFQQPSYVATAIAPKRSLILIAGLVFSLLSGCGVVVGYATVQRRLLALPDLAELLQLPLTGTLRMPSFNAAAL